MIRKSIPIVGAALSMLITSLTWNAGAAEAYPTDHIGSVEEVQVMLDSARDRQKAQGPAPKVSPSDEQAAEMVLTMLHGGDGKLSIEALESWTKERIGEKTQREKLSAIYDKRAQAREQATRVHCGMMMDSSVSDTDAVVATHIPSESANVAQPVLTELKGELSLAAGVELEKMIADVSRNMSVGDPEHQRGYWLEIANIVRPIYKHKCASDQQPTKTEQQGLLDGVVNYD